MESLSKEARLRYCLIKEKIKTDRIYRSMLTELTESEIRYDKVISSLSPEDMDTVCDFVSLLGEIDNRELEIACRHMVFRFETK